MPEQKKGAHMSEQKEGAKKNAVRLYWGSNPRRLCLVCLGCSVSESAIWSSEVATSHWTKSTILVTSI